MRRCNRGTSWWHPRVSSKEQRVLPRRELRPHGLLSAGPILPPVFWGDPQKTGQEMQLSLRMLNDAVGGGEDF